MSQAYYEHPNLGEILTDAAKASSFHGLTGIQASSVSTQSSGMLQSSSSGGGGDDRMLGVQVAKLQSDVENIKSNLSETRADVSRLRESSADTARDVAVVLQKIVDVDEKLSKKPSNSEVQTLISSAVNKQILWTIGTGFALLGIAKFIF